MWEKNPKQIQTAFDYISGLSSPPLNWAIFVFLGYFWYDNCTYTTIILLDTDTDIKKN